MSFPVNAARSLRVSVPLVLAGLVVSAVAVAPGAVAAQEGVRDCGDVKSESWVHYIEGVDDIDEYRGNQWFVYAGVGLAPSCSFAKRWAKVAVHEASKPARKVYKVRVRNAPRGWKCTATNSPEPVLSTGGQLQCLKYKKRKLVGSFSAGPDFSKQEGPF